MVSPIDLSHEARAARVSAYHRTLLTVPVPTAPPAPSPGAVGSRAAGTMTRETSRDEERTTVAPAAPPPGGTRSAP